MGGKCVCPLFGGKCVGVEKCVCPLFGGSIRGAAARQDVQAFSCLAFESHQELSRSERLAGTGRVAYRLHLIVRQSRQQFFPPVHAVPSSPMAPTIIQNQVAYCV